MNEPASIVISAFALIVSFITAWLTLFRRGNVKITTPTVVYFGADGPTQLGETISNKVFLRFLMYSTGKRGQVVESIFVTLRRNETKQTFNIWVYGDEKLNRGSGLFVGESGVVCNHHFLLPADGTPFAFLSGDYQVDVFASLVGCADASELCSIKLSLPESIAQQLKKPENGVYFDWSPDSKKYNPHVKQSRFLTQLPEILIPTLD